MAKEEKLAGHGEELWGFNHKTPYVQLLSLNHQLNLVG